MSFPLSTLFHGDVTIEAGYDTSLYGFGMLSVQNNVTILGTNNGSSLFTSALSIPKGGLSVKLDSYMDGILTVNSTSNLQTTNINTNLGGVSISGGNGLSVNVGSAINLISSSGNVLVNASSGSTIISSGDNISNAVQITATNNAGGGVTVLSGQSGGLFLTGGSGGIQEVTSAGSINLTANNASGSFVINSSASNQNLTLAQYGTAFSSGILISADGTGNNASILLSSTNTGGNILIQNNQLGGVGSIKNLSGAGGYFVTTLTGGSIGLTSNGANSYFYVNSTGGTGQTLNIGVTGGSYIGNQLILSSTGNNPTQAILITNTNTGGGVLISQPPSSNGGVVINTGSGGLSATTQIGGGVNLAGNGGSSSITNSNGNLLLGATLGGLNLYSTGTGSTAVSILSTGISGGILVSSVGKISMQSSDASNGINIGTINTVPINIGTSTSTTTVLGNLDVRGTTTTVESTTVQITDNIIQLNNGPSGTSDGGIAIKRYQPAVNTNIGDVVADTPVYTGTVTTAGSINITLGTGLPSTIPDLTGYWIRITGGTAVGEVRRIKSNLGSTGYTNVLSIFTSADQTTSGSPIYDSVPPQGLDWNATDKNGTVGAIPDATSTYALFPCQWIISMWDSNTNRYTLVCSQMVTTSSSPPIADYINLQINNLYSNALYTGSINNVLASIQVQFTLTDNSTNAYELNPANTTGGITFQNPYGIYIVMIRPTTQVAGTGRCSATFLIGSLGGSLYGQVARIISVKGGSGEQLDMSWPPSNGTTYTGYPCVLYSPSPGTTTTTSYTVKVIAV